MATSGVPPEEESGYAARIALLKKYNPWNDQPFTTYTYTPNHQIELHSSENFIT
jgi:hypothetical protein